MMMRWLKKQKGDQKDIKDLFKYMIMYKFLLDKEVYLIISPMDLPLHTVRIRREKVCACE